ncbi:hypothetical protein D9M69_593670 [compost metagenome]
MIADDRNADAQAPTWGRDRLGERCLGIVEIVEHPAAAFVKQPALVGQPQATCRALKKANAELFFETCHRLADGRGGQPEHASGGNETSEISRSHKGCQPAQAIHRFSYSSVLFRYMRHIDGIFCILCPIYPAQVNR